ncbi:hypothetical protein, partial [Cohnella sp. REN36]|uniref:hypothetical protein n=1 Tax=Cohnella sp. REN36 TaxID=2887347 RepID=UPI001D14C65C
MQKYHKFMRNLPETPKTAHLVARLQLKGRLAAVRAEIEVDLQLTLPGQQKKGLRPENRMRNEAETSSPVTCLGLSLCLQET